MLFGGKLMQRPENAIPAVKHGVGSIMLRRQGEAFEGHFLCTAPHFSHLILCRCCRPQRFPLGGDDEVMSSTLQQFAKVIDEVSPHCGTDLQRSERVLTPSVPVSVQLSSCHAVLSTQLADAMMFPITQFKERDLKGRRRLFSTVRSNLSSDFHANVLY